MVILLRNRGPGPEWVGLGPAGSVWVLDFVWERFHNTSPGDYEGMFIKVGDTDTRKGSSQKKQQERPRLGCV